MCSCSGFVTHIYGRWSDRFVVWVLWLERITYRSSNTPMRTPLGSFRHASERCFGSQSGRRSTTSVMLREDASYVIERMQLSVPVHYAVSTCTCTRLRNGKQNKYAAYSSDEPHSGHTMDGAIMVYWQDRTPFSDYMRGIPSGTTSIGLVCKVSSGWMIHLVKSKSTNLLVHMECSNKPKWLDMSFWRNIPDN